MACYVGWHNYRKRYLIKSPVWDTTTHAVAAGIDPMEIAQARKRMFTTRAFLSLIKLNPLDIKIWGKTIPTPGRGKQAYKPKFAVA